MVLPKATLTDTLIEGGLTPNAAERAAEMIALGYDEVAKQGEVDRSFAEADRRLDEQDRLNAANFRHIETTLEIKIDVVKTKLGAVEATLDAKIEALGATFDGKFEAVDGRFKAVEAAVAALDTALGGKIAAVDTRVTDLRAELNGNIQNLKDSMDAKFAAVDAQLAAVNQRINDLDKSINRLYWLVGLIATANFALFGYIISRLS